MAVYSVGEISPTRSEQFPTAKEVHAVIVSDAEEVPIHDSPIEEKFSDKLEGGRFDAKECGCSCCCPARCIRITNRNLNRRYSLRGYQIFSYDMVMFIFAFLLMVLPLFFAGFEGCNLREQQESESIQETVQMYMTLNKMQSLEFGVYYPDHFVCFHYDSPDVCIEKNKWKLDFVKEVRAYAQLLSDTEVTRFEMEQRIRMDEEEEFKRMEEELLDRYEGVDFKELD